MDKTLLLVGTYVRYVKLRGAKKFAIITFLNASHNYDSYYR